MDNLALIIDSVSTVCLVVVAIVTLSWKISQRNQGELQEVRDSINEIRGILFDINGKLGRIEDRLGMSFGLGGEIDRSNESINRRGPRM